MKDTLRNTETTFDEQSKKTDQEKAEASQLLDELLNELAGEQALAETLQDSLPSVSPASQ